MKYLGISVPPSCIDLPRLVVTCLLGVDLRSLAPSSFGFQDFWCRSLAASSLVFRIFRAAHLPRLANAQLYRIYAELYGIIRESHWSMQFVGIILN